MTTNSTTMGSRSQADLDAIARHQGGISEFFRYHGIWAPGVRLFRAIGFRAKAAIIAATFVLPIALLGWNYFNNQAAQIEFSAKERLGVVYARELMPLLELLQRQRMHSLLEASQPGSGAAELANLRGAIEAQTAKVAQVEARLGAELGTGKAWAELQKSAKALPAAGAGADAVFAAHSAHVQLLIDLIGVAADGSNLTLDPDIDSYYLMDIAVFRLPVMIEAVAQARGLGATVLAAGQATPAQQRRVIEQMTMLSSHLGASQSGIVKAVAYNAAVKAPVNFDEADAVVKAFAAQVEQTVLRGEGVQGDAAAHVAAANRTIDALMKLAERSSVELDGVIAARVERMESARNLCAGVLLIGMAAALYLFTAFRKVLDGGLREVGQHIEAMRDGDLTTRPRAWGADEPAVLMRTLAQMQESLRGIVSQVRLSSDSIVTASAQIAGGAGELQARTEQSAARLQETASAMEQITATVDSNRGSVDEASQLAHTNAQAAEQGGRTIAELVQTMQRINSSSGRIGDIIGTIDALAFQTNILALNAAVEAARAGEQGRGFAVVASEVRSLAQRSATAAREIRTLITSSVSEVEGGVKVVEQAGSQIDQIVDSAHRVRELLGVVAQGASEQTQGIVQSSQSVQEMDSTTQQNAALVEQTAAAAASLRDQAQALANRVAQFKLPATAS